jgi:DNA polymerase-3 subunit gamma/tau
MAERKPKTAAATPASESAPSPGSYTVLARRYRPQRFEDFVGQDVVVEALKRAIETNRVAHAYLFTGERGVGKTSMARMIAKALNCVNGPTIEPCGVCESCQAISDGQDVDVLEIDGASNNGVENIRELRQGVAYRPSHSRYKIYIIDEVHMVTTAAFNALLKTLEEPPPHVKFLFATTEPQKVPITILSRCQRFDFSGVEADKIQQRLREIVEAEGVTADDDALEIVARRANGSMRDSQSLLDQVIASVEAGRKITIDDAFKALGIASDERVRTLVAAILTGDAKAAMELAAQGAAGGVQLGDWVEQALEYFRDLMALSIDPNAVLVASSPKRRKELLAEIEGRSTERILELMDLLASCRARMSRSPYARTLFEMTLVRMCRLDAFVGVERALAAMSKQSSAPAAVPATVVKPVAGIKPEVSLPAAGPPPSAPEKKTLPAAESEPVAEEAPRAILMIDASNWRGFWREFLDELHETDQILAGMLHQCERVDCPTPNQLTIYVPGAMIGTCKNYAEHAKTRLDSASKKVAGRIVGMRFEVGTPAPAPVVQTDSPTKLRDEAARDPWVRAAENLFGAKIVSVDRVSVPAPEPVAAAVAVVEEDES